MSNDPSGIDWDSPDPSGIDWDKPEKPKTPWQQTKSMLPKSVEFVLGAGSGLAANALGGYAGMAGAALPGLEGQGADWVRKTQDALTYQPESKAAQKGLEIAGLPGEGLRYLGGKIGDPAAEKFGPLAGTAANILPDAAASLFGLRFPGTRASVAERMLPGGELPGVASAREARRVANFSDDAAARAANRSGFTLPPSQVNPSAVNRTLEWIADKDKTAKVASLKNQPLEQAKIREQFRIRPDEALDYNTFERVKRDAAFQYEGVRRTGKSTVSNEYLDDIAKVLDPLERTQQAYPGDVPSPAIARGRALIENTLDADAAVTKIRELRADAKKAKTAKDDVLADQYQSYANAVEYELGRHLERTGQPLEVIQRYREAREKIAAANDMQKALSRADEVVATRLADMKGKGAPLKSEMAEVANLGRYPKASQLPSNIGGVPLGSPLDFVTALLGGTKQALMLGVRPATRALITSEPFQRAMQRTYDQSLTGKTVQALTSPDAVMRMESFNEATKTRKRELARQLGLTEE